MAVVEVSSHTVCVTFESCLGKAEKCRHNIEAVGGSLKVSVYSECLTMLLLSHMSMMVQECECAHATTAPSFFFLSGCLM